MTTTAPSHRICLDCDARLTRKNHHAVGLSLCDSCAERAGHENAHEDGHHAGTFVEGCPMCDDAEAPVEIILPSTDGSRDHIVSEPTGRKNIDHSACPHPATKAARAKCRKAIAQTMAEIKGLSNIHDHE
jgi:hypothetical protein